MHGEAKRQRKAVHQIIVLLWRAKCGLNVIFSIHISLSRYSISHPHTNTSLKLHDSFPPGIRLTCNVHILLQFIMVGIGHLDRTGRFAQCLVELDPTLLPVLFPCSPKVRLHALLHHVWQHNHILHV